MKIKELPPNHKRVISVTAKTVEDELNYIELLLTSQKIESEIKKIIPSFSDEEKKYLLEKIRELRKLNKRMFEELNLESSEITEAQIVKGKITYLWTVLVDSKAKALKGYGNLPDDIAKSLDSYIDSLLKIITEIN
ncbi:MAG: hypothetical protein AB1695_08220 [Stygiobacter sp.]|jgi:predicted Zn-ribbon and HTH transcriptional regulator